MNANARTLVRTLAAAALVAAPALASPDRDLDPRESYSYVRALEGRATLASEGAGPGDEAEVNQPLLSGDRIAVGRGARIEIALADRNLLRVAGDTSVTLTQVAFSGDRGERATRLDLDEGEIQLVVTEEALGDSLPEIGTPGAEIIVHRPGAYRIVTDRSGWTELVVREGFAELVTSAGSSVVRAGESAITFGDRWAGVDLASAGTEDTLERWGGELDRRAAGATLYVEPELAYDAAPLAEYGSWVSYQSNWYWRPRVAVDWRPYWQGRWTWTPSGLTWVSSEPWGWVPYHYGTWCSLPGYGWAWRPGYVYSPAWVYWHWSDAWVGWCPVGYYTSWYGPGYYGRGFHFGIYGWASGGWGYYSHWNFGPTYCLRDRHQRRHWRRGGDLGRELGPHAPRGLVTTNTRGLPREGFADNGVAEQALLRREGRHLQGDQSLVDVTDFVARRRELSPEVRAALESREGDRIRLAEVPRANAVNDAGRIWRQREEGPGERATRQGASPGDRVQGPATRNRPDAADERSARGDVQRVAPRPGVSGDREPLSDERTTRRGEAPKVAPSPGAPGASGDRGVVRSAPGPGTVPSDRQGWRRDTDSGTPPSRSLDDRSTPRSVPRLEPGERAEIGPDGRIRRFPAGDAGRVAPSPRSTPGTGASSGDTGRVVPSPRTTPGSGAPSGDARQGWKSRESWSTPSRVPPSAGIPRSSGVRGAEPPVQRVLGGVRRSDGVTSPRTLPPSTTYRRPDAGSIGRTPGAPTARAPQTTPRTAPPSSGRTVTPPPTRRPPSSSSTRPSSGGSRSPGASSSSGRGASSPSGRGASSPSGRGASRQSSPPPHRKGDKD